MTDAVSIVIADLDESRRRSVRQAVSSQLLVHECSTRAELLRVAAASQPAVAVVGSLLEGPAETIEAAHLLRASNPGIKIVMIAECSSEAIAIGALRAGVCEYLKGPVTAREVAEAVAHVLPQTCPPFDDCPDLVGASKSVREVKDLLRRIAPMNSTVLITGETGTGKEVVARLIHKLSARSNAPLICINCAAIPDTLIEGELFGHERGAFTGAVSRQAGQLKAADSGTVFLDEVGDLSPSAQSKILRAIERREVQPLGAVRPMPVDIRIIAATHRDLETRVNEGHFRTDLFYRLHVSRIHLPPLRDRPEDIPLLGMHFLHELNELYGRSIQGFTANAMRLLERHSWPGNVRQLRNAIEGAVVISCTPRISEQDLQSLRYCRIQSIPLSRSHPPELPALRVHAEPESLMQALKATNWNVSKAADLLRWSRATIYRRMAKYGVQRASQPPQAAECEAGA